MTDTPIHDQLAADYAAARAAADQAARAPITAAIDEWRAAPPRHAGETSPLRALLTPGLRARLTDSLRS